MGSCTAWAITWPSQGPLRVPSPLHHTWSCLLPGKWQNPSLFSSLGAPLASKQQSALKGEFILLWWTPRRLVDMHENSDQDNPVCSQSSYESQSWSWLLYGFPPGLEVPAVGLYWHFPSLCSWSLPTCTVGLPWMANWSSKQTLVFCWPFSSCSHLWRA